MLSCQAAAAARAVAPSTPSTPPALLTTATNSAAAAGGDGDGHGNHTHPPTHTHGGATRSHYQPSHLVPVIRTVRELNNALKQTAARKTSGKIKTPAGNIFLITSPHLPLPRAHVRALSNGT